MTKNELTGKDGLLRQLNEPILLMRILNAEMDEHLGYKKYDNAGEHSGISRNRHSAKTLILDDNSTAEIHVPRDRNSTFKPLIIPKHEKHTPLFNDQIISRFIFSR